MVHQRNQQIRLWIGAHVTATSMASPAAAATESAPVDCRDIRHVRQCRNDGLTPLPSSLVKTMASVFLNSPAQRAQGSAASR